MRLELSADKLSEILPLATSAATEDEAATAQLAISSDVGLILLGVGLLLMSSYVFVAKLCKSLASSGEK